MVCIAPQRHRLPCLAGLFFPLPAVAQRGRLQLLGPHDLRLVYLSTTSWARNISNVNQLECLPTKMCVECGTFDSTTIAQRGPLLDITIWRVAQVERALTSFPLGWGSLYLSTNWSLCCSSASQLDGSTLGLNGFGSGDSYSSGKLLRRASCSKGYTCNGPSRKEQQCEETHRCCLTLNGGWAPCSVEEQIYISTPMLSMFVNGDVVM